jgi:hypothetical protein
MGKGAAVFQTEVPVKFRGALRKRLAEATPGPWCITYDGDHYSWTQDDGRLDIFQCGDKNRRGNVAFTRHARRDVEILLHELEKAEAALDYCAAGYGTDAWGGAPAGNDVAGQAYEALASLRAVLDGEEE